MHLSKSASPTLENSRDSLKLKSWILAARPKTLTAAVIPVLAGVALVSHAGARPGWVAAFALIGALAIQIATNFINDYIDHDKGADTHERIGPKRVTQSGLIARADVRKAAGAMLMLALLVGIPLVIHGGLPILLVGVISMLLAYCYTGGPFPLAYLGLGDAFVILFFGLIAVGGVFYLHTGYYNLDTFVLGLQIGLLSTVLIAINNLRDIYQDTKVAKRTLAVRLGVKFARVEIAALTLVPFILQAYWIAKYDRLAFMAPLLMLPLAVKVVHEVIQTEPSPAYNQFLAHAAALHAGFGVIISIVLYV